MATLEVPVRISAIDNLTAGLSNIAGHIGNINQQFRTFGGIQQNIMRAATALPSMGAATFILQQQAELDKQARLFQAFGNTTEEQRRNLTSLINEVAPKIGVKHLDLMKGATELVQAGLEATDILSKNDRGVSFLERIARAADAADEKVEALATDLAQLAFVGKFPFKTSAEKMSTFEMLSGIAMAAPSFSPDKPRMHAQALAQFGPILMPMMLGDNPTAEDSYKAMLQASALQNTLAFAFRGSLGGQGLKSIFQRVMSPTAASIDQMVLNGFDYGRIFNFKDGSKAPPDALIKMLLAGGIDVAPHRDMIAKHLDTFYGSNEDPLVARGKLTKDLGDELGLKSNERGRLSRGVNNFFALMQGKFNLEAFLEELMKLPPAAFKDVFGLYHAPKGSVLRGAEALSMYHRILEGLTERAPTALDTMSATRTEGWAFQTRRFEASLQTLRNAMWDSGSGAMLEGMLARLNNKLLELANMDPSKLNAISNSLLLLAGSTAGVTALGFAIGALNMALTPLIAFLTTPLGAGTVGAFLERRRASAAADDARAWSEAAEAAKARGERVPDLPPSLQTWGQRLWGWMSSGWGQRKEDPADFPGITLGNKPEGIDLSQRLGMIPALMAAAKVAEGGGTVDVTVRVDADGNARIVRGQTTGNVRLNTGEGMPDLPN